MRAAIAYAGKGQQPAMAALNVSRAGLGRLLHTKGKDRKAITWDDLWKVAAVCGVGHEWFTADFSRLEEIVPPGMPTFTKPSTPTLTDAAERAAQRRADRLRTQQEDQPQLPPTAQES